MKTDLTDQADGEFHGCPVVAMTSAVKMGFVPLTTTYYPGNERHAEILQCILSALKGRGPFMAPFHRSIDHCLVHVGFGRVEVWSAPQELPSAQRLTLSASDTVARYMRRKACYEGLSKAFLCYWRELVVRSDKNVSLAWRRLMESYRAWREGHGAPMPGYEECPPCAKGHTWPTGWGYHNLRNFAHILQ